MSNRTTGTNKPFTPIARESTKSMASSTNPLRRFVLVAGLLLAFQSLALGGTLTVSVLRPQGNSSVPLAGAQVCISGNFGTLSSPTNSSGTATFANAPQGQLTLTASATGFIGQSIQITMGAADKTQSFLLQSGSGGPVCNPVPPPPPVTLSSLVLNPTSVTGGTASQGTVTLSAAAPATGALVSLSSNNTSAATVPPSVNVSSGSSSATFTVSTSQVSSSRSVVITASSGGTNRTATLTVNPPPPATASLHVLVGRENSTAISGAAVCIASGAGSVSSASTDIGGQATFDGVPQGQITITVSSSGFTGQSHTSSLPASGGTIRFILAEGSGGPVCNAPAPPPATGPLAITFFDWHVNRKTPLFFEVALNFSVKDSLGHPIVPTHYRVGESSDLSSTQWVAYSGGVPLFQLGYRGNSLTAYGQRTIFLQVKKDDLTSPVASKTVDLQPVSLSEFRLEGSDLFAMLTFAEDRGFLIRTRNVSVTENICNDGLLFRRNTLDFQGTSGTAKDRDWVKVMEITLVDSAAKSFTARWRVKSIEVGQSGDFPGTETIGGISDGNGFKVTIRLTVPRDPAGGDPTFCLSGNFPLRAVVLEGPADDLALDQTKRWENMFPLH